MSGTRKEPTEQDWKAARAIVTAFNDTDCRCDRITPTEGAKENLKIKVAYALRQRELEVRAEAWQPIETAPKVDPTCRARGPLIYLGGPGWARTGWWSVNARWVVDHDTKDRLPPTPPTHWQPLPDPPAIRRDSEAQEGKSDDCSR